LIPRERILTALKGEEPDRVPISDQVYIHWLGLDKGEIAKLPLYRRMRYRINLVRKLNFDAIWVDLGRIRDDKDGRILYKGSDYIIVSDEWGGRKKMSFAQMHNAPQSGLVHGQSYLIEPVVKTLSDLDRLEKIAPDPWVPERRKPFEIVKKEAPELLIWGNVSSPFSIVMNEFRGFEQVIKDMFLNPEFCRELLKFTTEYVTQVARATVRAGAEVVTVHDGSASASVISPRLYNSFVFPTERDVIQAIKKEGAMAVLHMCGDSSPNLEKMVETGTDAVEPLDPLGGVDVADAKKRIGDEVCLKGGVNNNILEIGTPEQVIEEAKKVIFKAAPGGGYILASGNVNEPVTPYRNAEALSVAVKKYGSYPIRSGKQLGKLDK